jgi:hypothetical protein
VDLDVGSLEFDLIQHHTGGANNRDDPWVCVVRENLEAFPIEGPTYRSTGKYSSRHAFQPIHPPQARYLREEHAERWNVGILFHVQLATLSNS